MFILLSSRKVTCFALVCVPSVSSSSSCISIAVRVVKRTGGSRLTFISGLVATVTAAEESRGGGDGGAKNIFFSTEKAIKWQLSLLLSVSILPSSSSLFCSIPPLRQWRRSWSTLSLPISDHGKGGGGGETMKAGKGEEGEEEDARRGSPKECPGSTTDSTECAELTGLGGSMDGLCGVRKRSETERRAASSFGTGDT